MVKRNGKVIRVDKVRPFSPSELAGKYLSRMILDEENSGSDRIQVNHACLSAGCSLSECSHKPPFDEVYYGLSGEAILNLDGVEYVIGKDTLAFIPGGTFHALANKSKTEDFIFLTIWPGTPEPGVNEIYDMRKRLWGKTFVEESE